MWNTGFVVRPLLEMLGWYLVWEAEGLGQLADLTQHAQIFVQSTYRLLDALLVCCLRGAFGVEEVREAFTTTEIWLSQKDLRQMFFILKALTNFIFIFVLCQALNRATFN